MKGTWLLHLSDHADRGLALKEYLSTPTHPAPAPAPATTAASAPAHAASSVAAACGATAAPRAALALLQHLHRKTEL